LIQLCLQILDLRRNFVTGLDKIEPTGGIVGEERQLDLEEFIDAIKLDEGFTIDYYTSDYTVEPDIPMGKWVIDINEDLKETFQERKSLFQEEAKPDRGEIQLMDNERIIKLGAASDLSTFLHESMHLFIEVEKQFAAE